MDDHKLETLLKDIESDCVERKASASEGDKIRQDIQDGAAGLFVVTESYMNLKKLKPMAEIISWSSTGVDTNIMGFGPVESTKTALKSAGLDLKDMGLIEMNEAFCTQIIACIKQLSRDFDIDEEEFKKIINVNGGATALGHPLGATGAKLLTTMLHELQRRPNVEYGLITMCIGMGQGDAMILKNINGGLY